MLMVFRGCDLVCNAVCVACRCNNEGQCAELCELLRQTSKDWHDSVEALASRQTDTRQWTKRKSEAGASAASLDSLRSSYRVRMLLAFAFLPLAPASTHPHTHIWPFRWSCPLVTCVFGRCFCSDHPPRTRKRRTTQMCQGLSAWAARSQWRW